MRERDLFIEALQKTDPADRIAYLDAVCAGDEVLRGRVLQLLVQHEKNESFLLDSPAPLPHVPPNDTIDLPTIDCPPGTVIGPYKLLERIGEGGMGTVWMAQQTEPVKRLVALKLIKAGMDSRQVIARFEAERQALALMDHPNIAKVHDAGTKADGRPYFVMELVKGQPITKYCDEHRLTPRQRLELFVPVCQAVQHAHQKGIIHRDLKPSNVLVALYDGRPVPKVIDFGVAKAAGQPLTEQTLVTGFGAIVGTLEYMSPEQAEINQLDVDTRSDIYSLGVLVYELLTGSPPFSRKVLEKAGMLEMLRVIREQEPSRPSTKLSSSDTLPTLSANRSTEPAKLTKLVRGELDWIVMKALDKDRNRRYATANGFAADVERYLADEPVQACPPSVRYRVRKFVRRHKRQVIAGSLVFFALIAGVIGTTMGLLEARTQEAAARKQEGLAREEAAAKELARAEEAQQRKKAEANEKLAGERLVQVETEKKNVELLKQKAEEEKQIAQAVKDFLQKKLLAQADSTAQADALLRGGGSPAEAKPNPTIRELLDRAARELAPDTIEANFPKQPLVQAEILRTVGEAYRGIGEAATAIDFLKRSGSLFRQHHSPDHPETLETLHNLALAFFAAGKLPQAIELLEQVRDASVKKLGADHRDTLVTLTHLAAAYEAAGKLPQAIDLYEQARAAQAKMLGADHRATLATLHNLAVAYYAARKLPQAIELYEQVRDTLVKELGADHPNTLTTLANLAVAYRAAGKLPQAIELLELIRDAQVKNLGADHPSTLATLHHLAAAYEAEGKLPQAIELFEQVRDARVKKLGADHRDTLVTLANLAAAYRAARKLPQAIELLELIRDAQVKNLGADHPDALVTLANLAAAYEAARKLPQAIELLEQVCDSFGKKLGADHPHTLATRANLAAAYRAAGKLPQAIALLERVRDASVMKLGTDHPNTLITLHNLAAAYWALGKLPQAIDLLGQVRDARVKKLGADHPDTLTTLGILGDAYCSAGQGEKAATALKAFVTGHRKRYPAAHAGFAGLLAQVALNLLNCGEHATAEELLREILAVREKTMPESWETFNTQSMLGQALLGQARSASSGGDKVSLARAAGLYRDAEALLLKGYEGLRQRENTMPPPGKIRLPKAAQRLVELYDAIGKKEEATRWRTELVRTTGKLVGPVHEVGASVTLKGRLDAKTPALTYRVKLAAGKTYVIDMISHDPKALDPFLFLDDPAGKQVAQIDGDGFRGLNARIVYRAQQGGTYCIRATSYNAGRGEFTLTVRNQP